MNRYHLAFGAAALALLSMLLEPMLSDPPGLQTSYSYTPSGSRGFKELASKFRANVRAWHHTPKSLTGTNQTMLMLEPISGLLSGQSVYREELLSWVAAGNHLVMIPATYTAMQSEINNIQVEVPTQLRGSSGGIGSMFADAGYLLNIGSISDPTFLEEEPLQAGTLQLLSDLGSHEFDVSGGPCRGIDEFDDSLEVVAELDGEAVMLRGSWGGGSLSLLTLPQLFRNRSLAWHDHAGAAMALLHFDGGGLLIDEFFHGLPASNGIFDLMFKPPFHLLTMQLILFAILLLWAFLPRPYPIRLQLAPSRRSKSEHFDAMGKLMANGTESKLVMQRIHSGLLDDMRSVLLMPEQLPLKQIPAYLQRVSKAFAAQYKDLVDEMNHLNKSGRVSKTALLNWGNKAAQFRQNLVSTRSSRLRKNRS